MYTSTKQFQTKQLGLNIQKGATSQKVQQKVFKLNVADSSYKPNDKERPTWFPGNPVPEWLDGSLPADYGFDPLGLASAPQTLKWFQQAELQNSRWAMLGVAGILVPEIFTGNSFPQWYESGKVYAESPGSIPNATLAAAELPLFLWAETKRGQDYMKPGSQGDGSFFGITDDFKGKELGYPGGKFFDPLGFAKTSPERYHELKVSELKNGRLAMLAFAGLISQYLATGKSPLENLSDHISNPGFNNFATNGISLPFVNP